VAQYQYDGSNRRIVKLTYSGGTLSETRHFYYTSQWQDIEERIGSPATMDRQYVWGIRYVDELICRDDSAGTRLFGMQDANFNLTAIADIGGVVKERYRFDPYGNRTIMNASWGVITSSAYAWTIGHQGLMHDLETGLVQNRERMLHALLGIFTAMDPLGYVGNMNLYQYLRSNPLIGQDPTGLVDAKTANSVWKALKIALDILKQQAKQAAGKGDEYGKALSRVIGLLKDLGVDPGNNLAAGLSAFANSTPCNAWYGMTMIALTRAANGNCDMCCRIRTSPTAGGPYEGCMEDIIDTVGQKTGSGVTVESLTALFDRLAIAAQDACYSGCSAPSGANK
jgi:RHS repeat-associated protein